MGGAFIGGAIGAFTGGVRGGLKAQKDGKTFWRGSTVIKQTATPDYSIPNILQKGEKNCTQTSAAAIDQSTGGTMTQEDVANRFPNSYDVEVGTEDVPFWDEYGTSKGVLVQRHSANQSDWIFNEVLDRHSQLSTYTERVALSLNDHSVVLTSVTKETIIRQSGKIIEKYFYNVMDPAHGAVRTINSTSVKNTFFLQF